MDKIQGFILMGEARRWMGEPKYALDLGGRTFVEIVADALRGATANQLTIVGDVDNRYLNVMSADKIKDIIVEMDLMKKKVSRGALIGLNTALLHAESEWIAVLACDLPFVSGDLMTRLAKPIPGLPLPAEAWDNVGVRIPVRAT